MTLRDFPKHSQRSSLALAFAFTVIYTCLWVKTVGTVLGTVGSILAVGLPAVGYSVSCLWLQQLPSNYAVLLPVCGRC
jgi:hypothetical protein